MAQRSAIPLLIPARPAGGNGAQPPGGEPGPGPEAPAARIQTGLWFLLVAVAMLFVAFTVSYLARRTAPDWRPVPLPALLWINTLVLLSSSAALEEARRRGRRGAGGAMRRALGLTALLGGVFLFGQIAAWRELAAAGLFMRTSPHSAFFYLLTAVHGVHLLGGLGALGYALRRVAGAPQAAVAVTLGAVAIYWHFLTVLWIYLLGILWV